MDNPDLTKIRSYTEAMCELRLQRLQEDLRQFDKARKHLEDMTGYYSGLSAGWMRGYIEGFTDAMAVAARVKSELSTKTD